MASSATLIRFSRSFVLRRLLHRRSLFSDSHYDDFSAGDNQRRRELNERNHVPKSEKNPFLISGPSAPFKIDEVSEGFYMRVDMPRVSRDQVKVWVENDTVFFEGSGSISLEHDDTGRSYGGNVELFGRRLKMEAIEPEVKNGVLRFFVPKLKLEDRKDVFRVTVED